MLATLMDHRSLNTTKHYYRVGEARRRDAVDRVTALQFDRHGNRLWRTVQNLLDTEQARRGIGEVAVPYGICGEPSNVKAGGHACPYRFRCVACPVNTCRYSSYFSLGANRRRRPEPLGSTPMLPNLLDR